MKSGYKIEWTDNALDELKATFKYLEESWTERELSRLSNELERILNLISINPGLFPISEKQNIRRVVIKKLNSLYYREMPGSRIEILSFFANRQDPDKRKI